MWHQEKHTLVVCYLLAVGRMWSFKTFTKKEVNSLWVSSIISKRSYDTFLMTYFAFLPTTVLMSTSTVLTMRIPLSPQSWLRYCVCNIWFSAQDVESQQAGHLLSIREIKADRGQCATPISTKGHWTALHAVRPRPCSVSGANASAKAKVPRH